MHSGCWETSVVSFASDSVVLSHPVRAASSWHKVGLGCGFWVMDLWITLIAVTVFGLTETDSESPRKPSLKASTKCGSKIGSRISASFVAESGAAGGETTNPGHATRKMLP